ncbi:MAG: hypothetical protein SH857_13680 [Chitinophagales bacterium]|nr:hypothetical protein [Chitinophagales bacterium]
MCGERNNEIISITCPNLLGEITLQPFEADDFGTLKIAGVWRS